MSSCDRTRLPETSMRCDHVQVERLEDRGLIHDIAGSGIARVRAIKLFKVIYLGQKRSEVSQ